MRLGHAAEFGELASDECCLRGRCQEADSRLAAFEFAVDPLAISLAAPQVLAVKPAQKSASDQAGCEPEGVTSATTAPMPAPLPQLPLATCQP
jgi:hypothetical protein